MEALENINKYKWSDTILVLWGILKRAKKIRMTSTQSEQYRTNTNKLRPVGLTKVNLIN